MKTNTGKLSANEAPEVSAANKMIQVISTMISTGRILPGERFPAERKLAEEHHVSRNTVREALHYYETLGMVEKKVGSGNYLVDNPDTLYRVIGTRQLLERYNWMEMIETRRILELGIVRLAAERATREDKLTLRKMCDDVCKTSLLIKKRQGNDAYTEQDYQLHREIARITRNSILLEMFDAIKDTFIASKQVWEMSEWDVASANESHERIIRAIIIGDADQAAQEMNRHLDDMTNMVLAVQKK